MINPTSSSELQLRPYQREDVEFLKAHQTAGCFNEQRTGKTPTIATVCKEKGFDLVLIVCPASALYPWQSEYKKWTGIPATVVTGTPAQKQTIVDNWTTGALIISYGSLKAKNTDLLEYILLKKPDACIIDEAHRIKDRTTANAKAVFELAKYIPNRYALTGTPAPNKPEEIWSLLHFINPKLYKSYWNFISEYFITHTQSNSQGRMFKQIDCLKPSRVTDLQNILNNCATQRKRKDVMPWLPEKEYQKILLPATKEQQKYLTELQNYFETEDIVTQGILDRLTRYRQICLHPALLNLKGKSPKLDWIKDYLTDYPERPTIVFSKFTSFIHILDEDLNKSNIKHAIIVGATSAEDRYKAVNDFQAGKNNFLILNIDAGKENLTLDRAEACIFTDKFPPVGDLEQAEARFVATTKDRADKPHIIYELIIQGTYDEQLYELIEKRAAAVDAINNFKSYMKGEN